MKKLFALVLVFAMALAIAVPALATEGWDKPEAETPTYSDFTITVAKYEYYKSTGTAGYNINGEYFAVWADTKGIVTDTMGRAVVSIDLPSLADAKVRYPGVDFSNLKVTVTMTNVKEANEVGATNYFLGTNTANISSKNVYKRSFDLTLDATKDTEYEQMFIFKAAANADVVVTATVTAGATALPATFLYGSDTIKAYNNGDGSYMFAYDVAYGKAIKFDTTTADKVNKIFVRLAGTTADMGWVEVFKDANGNIAFKNGGTSIYVNDTGYAALKSVYDYFMGALKFEWDNTTKYMNEDLILENLIAGAKGSASVTFPSGTVTVTNPTVTPPQTGDATTVVGFVMIAIALIAAAAVTVKKVRA